MTATPPLDVAQPVLQPVHCAPWCRLGNGHTDRGHPDDQWCSTPRFRVFLRNGELVQMGDGSTEPAHISVQVYSDPDEAAFVTFDNAPADGFKFTPQEVDELAEVLRHAAWVARQGGSSR